MFCCESVRVIASSLNKSTRVLLMYNSKFIYRMLLIVSKAKLTSIV